MFSCHRCTQTYLKGEKHVCVPVRGKKTWAQDYAPHEIPKD